MGVYRGFLAGHQLACPLPTVIDLQNPDSEPGRQRNGMTGEAYVQKTGTIIGRSGRRSELLGAGCIGADHVIAHGHLAAAQTSSDGRYIAILVQGR